YLLSSAHYDSQFDVLVRFNAWSASGYYDFEVQLDQFKIYFENHTLDFTSEIYVNESTTYKTLYYSYKLDTSQELEFKVWNYVTEMWDVIKSGGSSSFMEYSFNLNTAYFSQDNKVLLGFYATTEEYRPFELSIDTLRIESTSYSEEERTGIEKYHIGITYSAEANFYLFYRDDNGERLLGILDSSNKTTFEAQFSPILLDSRISFRIIQNESFTPVSLFIDRIYLFSESTDKINDLIFETDDTYDEFYADLEFNNAPSLVDAQTINIPLIYVGDKGDAPYYVFKITEVSNDIPFTVDRVKFIDDSHGQNKTILSREVYHHVGDEIYIDSTVALDPKIIRDSILNVDISYIYNSWEKDEYVDTQPYTHNFSISAAQRIESVAFVVKYAEIPQIQSWFFGTTDEGDMYKQLSSKLIKDVNLIEIEFYDFASNTWNSTNYVVYDLNDNDASTFGYFIDRYVLAFLRCDGLPDNDLLYQLKYRFKIDKNYFGDDISTKTFFDMEDLTVQIYYNPIKSVISLNPQLEFSADITDVILPEGENGIVSHVNELSFDLDWNYGISVADSPVEGAVLDEVFYNKTIYSNNATLYVLDKFGTRQEVNQANNKFYLKNTNQENVYDYIKFRHGKYFVDFLLDYEWELRGLISYLFGTIFDLNAYIEITNCDVRAKVTTINKELITPISMPENGTVYVGDISGDTQNDIGFMGGFLEKVDNNDRFFVKYQFSYLFDADNDDIFNSTIDPQVYFAEFVQDICFTSADVEGFLYYDGSFDDKIAIIGNETWLDLTTTSNVDEAYIYTTTISETKYVGEFNATEGTNNKFTYNWTQITAHFNGDVNTGDEFNLTVELIDIDSGTSRNITYVCLADFDSPTSVITIGDGQTDYSFNNYVAPWTEFSLTSIDNLQGVINHSEYYYDEVVTEEFQVKVFDKNDNSVYISGFKELKDSYSTLHDLGIPVANFEEEEEYYYIIEFRVTDAAGNSIVNSSYLGDSYTYNGGMPKILVSNNVTIQFANNIINVNDLYDGIGTIVNFTLIGPDGSELKDEVIQLKSGNYYFKVTLWNDTTQSYNTIINSLYDLILYSDNIFGNQLYANFKIDRRLYWDATGDDYYAFAKHASEKDPLILTYFMQEEKTAIMYVPDKESFRLFDYLNYIEVYCYIWNEETQAYNSKHVFEEDHFTVHENGTVSWNVDIDQMDIKNNEVFFTYYSSDFANLILDSQKNGMFMTILVPNLYSTHCTIDRFEVQFKDLDDNTFTYAMDYLDFDQYFKNATLYKRVIPGLSELLEIPIYIDFGKLGATNMEAIFDITKIYSVNFIVIDTPVWPGSISMYDPNTGFTIMNFPYQIFGVSNMAFYDILADNSTITVKFEDFDYDFISSEETIVLDEFDNIITDLEFYDGDVSMSFTGLNTLHFADTIDVYFRFNGKTEPFPLYDMTTSIMALCDNSTNTLLGISLLDWDNSVDKYHCTFTIMEDVKESGEDYVLKLVFSPTELETQVNSTSMVRINLLPQILSEICLKNEREVIFNPDYSFTLNTKFGVEYGEEWRLLGYILDNSTYYRTHEVIPYKATDPIGQTTITEYEIDMHGLIGDSDFIDKNNFKLAFIDRENYNEITPLFEVVNGTSWNPATNLIEDCWISYYAYHMVDHPNKFMLVINWTSDDTQLIPYDTELLLTYRVMQGKLIIPVTFEDIEDVAIPVDFIQYDYYAMDWLTTDTFREIINLDLTIENSSLFTGVAQDQTITVDNSSIGSGIVALVDVWKGDGSKVDSSDYNYSIVEENGIDALKVTYIGTGPVDLKVEYLYI
ncbi:MAG: hypothetical protein HWN66_19435, partial [Candidatus Helarchaeota archaeon]|nr:hypothetical protein [Candidatus Helarchaeota archaeon]